MLYLAIDQKPFAFRMIPLDILLMFTLKIPRMKEKRRNVLIHQNKTPQKEKD